MRRGSSAVGSDGLPIFQGATSPPQGAEKARRRKDEIEKADEAAKAANASADKEAAEAEAARKTLVAAEADEQREVREAETAPQHGQSSPLATWSKCLDPLGGAAARLLCSLRERL